MFKYNEHRKMLNRFSTMNIAELEYEILNDALEAFKNEIKLDIEEMNLQAGLINRHDAIIEIRFHDRPLRFYLEIKANINNANVGKIANQMKIREGHRLLVTRYVNPQLARKLKELEIPFLDTVGNMYINFLPVYIFVIGNKIAPKKFIYDRNEAWGPAKLRVIFALLCHDRLENKNYRTIARVADTALGTVNWTFRDLTLKGFIIRKNNKERRIVDKIKLLDKWVELYPEKLRPQTFLGRFDAKKALTENQIDITRYNAKWGGEIAANKITQYLRPEIFTIYTDKKGLNELIFQLGLRKNPKGNVEIRRRFWGNEQIWNKRDTVNPVLIYADLLATAEPRNIETARVIYDQFILRYIGENR